MDYICWMVRNVCRNYFRFWDQISEIFRLVQKILIREIAVAYFYIVQLRIYLIKCWNGLIIVSCVIVVQQGERGTVQYNTSTLLSMMNVISNTENKRHVWSLWNKDQTYTHKENTYLKNWTFQQFQRLEQLGI